MRNHLGVGYLFLHSFVAFALMIAGTLVALIFASIENALFFGCAFGAGFYWGREKAQWEMRDSRYEWEDKIIPTITNVIILIILLQFI
ncbi:MAG: hypothetical protein LAT57_00080 [Balneolales bacterium]|nr:hypothetical protein [Balneolales bacterium]